MSKAKPPLDPAVEKELTKAIQDRDAAAVARLVATGIDLNTPLKGHHNQTPLETAVQYGTNDVAVVLLKAGADWREGGLNLVWAVYHRDEWLTRKLIELGADLNYKGRIMGRPLSLATSYKLSNLMRLLIDAGADIDSEFPVCGAVQMDFTEGALMLLNAGAVVPRDQNVVPWAAQRGNREVLKALIKAGVNLDEKASLTEYNSEKDKHLTYSNDATGLILAAGNGVEGIVQDLIEAGADLYAKDATGAMAIDLARKNQHSGVVALLESAMAKKLRPANPSADLIFAAEAGELAKVKEFLAAGADPNVRDTRPKSKGLTPLMLAARAGHRGVVAALLDAGADITLKDDADPGDDMSFNFMFNEGGAEYASRCGFCMFRDALHWAIKKGNEEIVRLLLKRGAEVNGVDRAKFTPLHMAAEAGASEIVQDLLSAGADSEARARGKSTPLHSACKAGDAESVRALLVAGAKVDMKNDQGDTPLIVAARYAHPEIVSALLKAGADVNVANRNLETAIYDVGGPHIYEKKYEKGKGMVVMFKRPESEILETARLLIEAGADPLAKTKHGSTAMGDSERRLKDSPFYQGIIELYRKAQSRTTSPPAAPKAVKPKVVAAKLEPKKSSDDEPAPLPDFSNAAKNAKFVKALSELEALCGTKPQPLDQVSGGFVLHVQTGKKIELEKVHADFLKKGCYVFSPDTTFENRIGVLPTAHKYDVLLAMQTNGQNFDLMPQDVIKWLRELDAEQPFIITSAGFDFLGGSFTTKIAKPAALAKRMYEFCPDIVDQGAGDVKALAAELKKSQTLFFWWD